MPSRGNASPARCQPLVLLVPHSARSELRAAADLERCQTRRGCFVILMLKRSCARGLARTCQEVEKQQANKRGLSSGVGAPSTLPQAGAAFFVLLRVWLFRCWSALPFISLGYGEDRPYLLAPKG